MCIQRLIPICVFDNDITSITNDIPICGSPNIPTNFFNFTISKNVDIMPCPSSC